MIIVKSISNFDEKGKALYHFWVSPDEEAAPTLTDYPHMQDGSTYATVELEEDAPAKAKLYVFTGGEWVEVDTSTGGGGGGGAVGLIVPAIALTKGV